MGKGDVNIIKNSLPADGFSIVEGSNIRMSHVFGNLEIPVLSNFNLKIEREDCPSIETLSCSGKNTHVNHIGFLGCTENYVVRENDLNRISDQEFVNHWDMKIWFFQFFNRIQHLTALDNALCSTFYDSITSIDPIRFSKELFDVMELPDCMYISRNISRNRFQKISIASALINDSAILFLEETLETLDPTKEA